MPQMSLGNGYSIDLADGWALVHTLQDALKQMQDGFTSYCQNLTIGAPGNDAHSGSFADDMSQNAVNAHETWFMNTSQQFNTMIDNVKGILQQYGIAETENTIQWAAAPTYNPNDNSDDMPRGRHGAV
jgi:hypothetical protein